MSRYFSGRFWSARYWGSRFWATLATARQAIRAEWCGGPVYRATWRGTMTDDQTIVLNIDEDFLAQADLESPATTTGVYGALTGQTTCTFRIAATRTGSALGSLSATASERSGFTGRYYYTFDASDLRTALADYLGKRVYVILSQAGNVDRKWWPVVVTEHLAGDFPA